MIPPSETWDFVIEVCISTADCFAYMAIYDLEIRLVESFSVL